MIKKYKILMIFLIIFMSACDNQRVINDPSTKLMWQDNTDAKKVKKPWLSKKMYDAEKFLDTSGDTAATYCGNLSIGNYQDWRLPTEDELGSLVDSKRSNPSSKAFIKNTESDFYWTSTTPGIDDSIIIEVNGSKLASKVTITKNGVTATSKDNIFSYAARIVYFSHGKHGASDKSQLGNVRCVRNNMIALSPVSKTTPTVNN